MRLSRTDWLLSAVWVLLFAVALAFFWWGDEQALSPVEVSPPSGTPAEEDFIAP